MPIPMLTRASAGVESAAVVAVAAPATNAALSASFANLFIVDSLVLAFPSIAKPLWEGTAEPQMNNVNLGAPVAIGLQMRSEEHTSELQSHVNLVCRLLLEKKKRNKSNK